jgi:Tol biopolymer transport system component
MASTWSPDGTKIAFYEDGYLWLTDAKHVFTRRLVRADFADAAPSWSRRGRIAFDRGGGIWTTNVRGTVVRRLKNGGEPSWSPDGRRVAFSATPPGGENNDIYVMRADGSGRHRLTATKAANEGQPSWSPNGRWISYSGKKGIYLIRSNGTKNRLFIEKGRQAGWSPGSNALVFAQRTPAWDGLIFRIDLNGKNKRQLLKPKVDAGPMWSPNGDRLAFTRGGIVNVVNANDRTSVHSIGLRGSDPAWSPDGSLIVVGSGSQLEVSNSDGSGSATIPLELDYESYVRVSEPDWSPDGSKIAFVATEASGTRDLFLVSPTGSSPTRIPVGCGSLGATSPSWSPDGNWLVFNCEGSIAIAHPDGSLLTPLTSGQNATIAWSPDGSQIAFSEQTDEEPAQLFVVNADGSVRQQLTTGPGASDEPDWQPHP